VPHERVSRRTRVGVGEGRKFAVVGELRSAFRTTDAGCGIPPDDLRALLELVARSCCRGLHAGSVPDETPGKDVVAPA